MRFARVYVCVWFFMCGVRECVGRPLPPRSMEEVAEDEEAELDAVVMGGSAKFSMFIAKPESVTEVSQRGTRTKAPRK